MNNSFDPKTCRYSSQWRMDNALIGVDRSLIGDNFKRYSLEEMKLSKYWSKPKGDSADSDWEDYGSNLAKDIMPEIILEIKQGDATKFEIISWLKEQYKKMWQSKK